MEPKLFTDKTVVLPDKPAIYRITCHTNGKIYIGSAIDARNRFYKHRLALDKGKHHSSHLQRSYVKYGATNFSFEILVFVDKKDLITTEQKYIDELKPEFNMNPVAGSNLGRKMSDNQKQKLRVANLGKKLTPTNRAIAIKNLRPPTIGFKHSLATKKKMSLTRQITPPIGMLGKNHTQEALDKISVAAAKTYSFVNPMGEIIEITNLSDFCADKGLIKFHLYAVHAGKRKSHKGWTKPL